MLYAKSSNIGVDVCVDRYQRAFFKYLMQRTGLSEQVIQGYPRAFRQRDAQGNYHARVFAPESVKDYAELVHKAEHGIVFFFGVGEQTTGNINLNVAAHLVVIFNFDIVRKTATNGLNLFDVSNVPDNEAIRLVRGFTQQLRFGFRPTNFTTGLERCFAEYNGTRNMRDFQRYDMYPMFCCRQDFNINYNNYTTY